MVMNGAISQPAPGNSGRPSAFAPSDGFDRLTAGKRNATADKAGSDQRPAGRDSSRVTMHFQIDRMTLPGMSRPDTTRVVAAMKQGLARLASKFPGRNWQGLSAIDRLDGGTLPAGARPEQIGEHLAAQIFRRLSR